MDAEFNGMREREGCHVVVRFSLGAVDSGIWPISAII